MPADTNDDDLSDLYQEIILGHNRRPRNEGELVPCDGRADGFNPLCGDKVTVFVRRGSDGLVERVQFVGEGCAISRASASMMTTAVSGKPEADVRTTLGRIIGLLTDKDAPPIDLADWGDLAALAGVRRFPARIKCATLSWHALEDALGSGGNRS